MGSTHFLLFEATQRFLLIPFCSSERILTHLVVPRSLYVTMILSLVVDIPRQFSTDFLGLMVLHGVWVL